MSERGSGSMMDYEELKRRHDRYKSKQRMAMKAAQAEEAKAAPVPAPAPAPEKAPVPAADVADEAPRRGAQADFVHQETVEPAEELELGSDQDVNEEVYDTGEPDDESASGGLNDSQNPFNQFFVAFGKMKDYMQERKAKKAGLAAAEMDELGEADAIEGASDEPAPDGEAMDLGEGAFEDEPEKGGVLGKLTGAFRKFPAFGKKQADEDEYDDLDDIDDFDELGDADDLGDLSDMDDAGEEPAAPAEEAEIEELPAAEEIPAPEAAEPDYDKDDMGDFDEDSDDDFDWDEDEGEDEEPRKKRGIRDMFGLFVRRADKKKEPEIEDEEIEDDFSIDFDGFDEPFQAAVVQEEQPVIPKGDDTVEEKTQEIAVTEESVASSEAHQIMEAGLTRRERRELAMKKAQEEAARLEAELAEAETEQETEPEPEAPAAEIPAEELAPAPAAEETAPAVEEPAPVQSVTPSIFDDPVPGDMLIAQVDEPTREFRPVHAAPAAAFDLFGDEEDEEDEEEAKPEKKKRGLFGRKKSRVEEDDVDEDDEDEDEEEVPQKKSRRSRRHQEDEEEEKPRRRSRYEEEDEDEEDDRSRRRRSRYDDEEDEDEEYESRRSRRNRRKYGDEDDYDEYESRRSRRRDYDDEDDDIDYDDYDYNDDDGAGHGFLYHLSGFLKAVTMIVIVLLVVVIGLNVWDYIGNKNGSDSPVDTMSEHLREYAPGVFDVLFPVSGVESVDEADDGATIELGEGWDTSDTDAEEGETAEAGDEPELVG